MRMRRLRTASVLATLVLAPAALAQPPVDDTPPKPIVVEPGRGPQIPFDEARWEFWWFYNREPHVRLQAALEAGAAGNADVDVPYSPPTQQDVQESIIPHLVQMLRDDNPDVRAAATQALARTRDLAVRPSLFAQLRDPNFLVRLQAIVALGVWGETLSLPRLEAIIGDGAREQQERLYAGVSLGLIGGPAVAESFKQFLAPAAFKAVPRFVQSGLAYGAGVTRDGETAPLVRALLADKNVTDFEVRAYLVLSLGKVGDETDQPWLIGRLGDPDFQTRRSAAIALGVLARRSGAQPVVDALIKAARGDADLMVRNLAYISLGYVGGAAASKALRTEFDGAPKVTRPFVALALGLSGDPESVPALQRALAAESDPSMRGALAIALGLHRDARAAPELRKAFPKEGEPVAQGYMALALGMLGDVEAVPLLRKRVTDAVDVELIPNIAIALGLLGDREGVAALVQRARTEKNEHVLRSLLYGIGLTGDRSAIPALIALAEAPAQTDHVRRYCATALGLLADGADVRALARVSADSNYTIIANFLDELFLII